MHMHLLKFKSLEERQSMKKALHKPKVSVHVEVLGGTTRHYCPTVSLSVQVGKTFLICSDEDWDSKSDLMRTSK